MRPGPSDTHDDGQGLFLEVGSPPGRSVQERPATPSTLAAFVCKSDFLTPWHGLSGRQVHPTRLGPGLHGIPFLDISAGLLSHCRREQRLCRPWVACIVAKRLWHEGLRVYRLLVSCRRQRGDRGLCQRWIQVVIVQQRRHSHRIWVPGQITR